jgi:hypothetical protein
MLKVWVTVNLLRSGRCPIAAWLGLSMKITLQLPPDLERQLLDSADRSQQTPEALIVQTLRQHLPLFPDSTGWPQVVLDYAGDPEFPAFESARDELLSPSEPDLF